MPKDVPHSIADEPAMLADAPQSRCRWIVRRERFAAFVICGRKVKEGSSYCPEHHALVWRPGDSYRKR